MKRKIFVNLPVKDLEKSKSFFSGLGFEINPKFTNDDGACIVISDTIYTMLLTEEFFKGFTSKKIADAHSATEAINAVSFENREDVDIMAEKAVQLGGTENGSAKDYGFMYSRSFHDLDGHIWEILWIDEEKADQ